MDKKELSNLIKAALVAAGSKGKFLSDIQKEFRAKGVKAGDRAFRGARDILVRSGEVQRSGNGLLVAKQSVGSPAKTPPAKPKKTVAPPNKVSKCDDSLRKDKIMNAIDEYIDDVFDEVADIVTLVSKDVNAGVEPCECPSSYFSKALDLAVESGLLSKHVIYTSPKFGQTAETSKK